MAHGVSDDRPGDDRGEDAQIIAFPGSQSPTEAPATDPLRWKDLVGDVLRDERVAQQRTLADVARAAAVSLPYLSEVERGRKDVSSDVLAAIHRALGLELADVVERVGRRLDVGPKSNGPTLLAA